MSKARLLGELAKRSAAASGTSSGNPVEHASSGDAGSVAEDRVWHEAGGLDVEQLRIGETNFFVKSSRSLQ